MAYNEQCKFTSALVTLNAGELKAAAAEQKISADTDEGLDRIINLIRDDLVAFAKQAAYSGIPAQWRPSSFAIIPGIFDENNGLVNSTMKLVRHKVRDHYRSRIDEIYLSGSADPCTPGNREALRKILES
jgi:long-chain acyl-CoA synthetase